MPVAQHRKSQGASHVPRRRRLSEQSPPVFIHDIDVVLHDLVLAAGLNARATADLLDGVEDDDVCCSGNQGQGQP
jgi:hypothetical protein